MHIALPLAITATLLPAMALAQAAGEPHSFSVTGQVPGGCVLGAPSLAAGALVNFRGLNGTTLQIDQIVDTENLSTNPASAEISLDANCSFPHTLRVESQNNGLWRTSERTAAAPEGFADAIPYHAAVHWASENLTFSADAHSRRVTDGTIFVNRTATGSVLIRLDVDAGATNARANAPLVAGVYGDTLRITLEPQQ
jgi:hypothetical protein